MVQYNIASIQLDILGHETIKVTIFSGLIALAMFTNLKLAWQEKALLGLGVIIDISFLIL